MFSDDNKEISLEIGGITYYVECSLVDDFVIDVHNVRIRLGYNNIPDIKMTDKELEEFYQRYCDDLNDAWGEYIESLKEDAALSRMDK